MPIIPARFRRPDPQTVKADALRKDVEALATTMKAMQGIGSGTTAASAGAMGPVMPGSQFQGGWNNLGNASMAMLQRVTANMSRQHNVPVADIEQQLIEQGLTWGPPFPPGRPLDPFFGYRRQPRTRDYSVGENTQLTPRWNRISFETIKGIYDAYDVAQIIVRHLINDVRSLDYSWVPLEGEREDVSEDIATARAFFQYPDRAQPFRNWLAEYLQDVLRYDAGTLYVQRTEAGDPYCLEVVTGASIIPIIDFYGRVAADRDDNNPPGEGETWPGGDTPGFLQIIQGMPWDWLTKDDIIYQPWNPLPESQYGLAPLEAVLLTANTDIRFQWHFLQYFTEGTLPAGFMEAPPDMSDASQLAEWQDTWDALMQGDQSMLRQIRWVPNGAKFTAAKNSDFDSDFPLYLMRRVCAAYGVTPADLGFTETVNKATSEIQIDVQWRVGTLPLVRHVEDVINMVAQQQLGLRCALQFDKGQEIEDQLSMAQVHQAYVDMGVYSLDEVRAELGKPIDRSRPFPRYVSSSRTGPIPLIAVTSMAGKIDEDTYGPAEDQPFVSNPYMSVPGMLPQAGTPEYLAAQQASAQAGKDMLAANSGGQPTGAMAALIAQQEAKSNPAGAAGAAPAGTPSGQGPAGTTAQPAEAPPGQGAGATPTPAPAAKAEGGGDGGGGGISGAGNLQGAFTSSSGIQGDPLSSGSKDPDDDDFEDDMYAYNEEYKTEKAQQLEIRRWRENARNRLRKGRPPTGGRPFHTSIIKAELADQIRKGLEQASTRQEVDAVFAEAASKRPFLTGPDHGSGVLKDDDWVYEARDESGEWTDGGGGVAGIATDAWSTSPEKFQTGAPSMGKTKKANAFLSSAVDQSSSDDDKAALEAYQTGTGNGTAPAVNAALRGGNTLGQDAQISALDHAVSSGVVKQDVVAYRGIPSSAGLNLKAGDTFTDAGFVSTTMTQGDAEQFANQNGMKKGGMLVEVHVPKGSHAASMANAGLDSSESEMLLGRGSSFRVESVGTKTITTGRTLRGPYGNSLGVEKVKMPHVVVTYLGSAAKDTAAKSALVSEEATASRFLWNAGDVQMTRAASKSDDRVKAGKHDFAGVVAAGLIVQAQDTGRVLMIQRLPDKHDDDASYARWEWPGGCLDVQDDGVWDGALREWEEETGSALPEDAEHQGSFLDSDGKYQGYVIQVPSEAGLEFDIQPDEIADVGWWEPTDLMDGQVRDKVRENLPLLDRFIAGPVAKEWHFDPGEARGPNGEWLGLGGLAEGFQREPGKKRGNGWNTAEQEDKAADFAKKAIDQHTTDAQRQALDDYASTSNEGDIGKGINAALRLGTPPSGDAKKTMDTVDKAIAGSTVKQDMVTYRGIPNGALSDLKPGDTFTDKGYASTSMLAATGEYFAEKGGTLVEVRVPKGSHALSMDNANIDNSLGESEVLLPHGSKFKVESVEDSPSKGVTGGKFRHVVVSLQDGES